MGKSRPSDVAYREANREKYRLRAAEWRKNNPARHRATIMQWVRANYDRHLENGRRWHRQNPDKRKGDGARRRARKQSTVADLTRSQWHEIVDQYGARCAYCGRAAVLTQEHIDPISRGGCHTADNVVPSCRSCNSSKGAKSIIMWLATRIGNDPRRSSV